MKARLAFVASLCLLFAGLALTAAPIATAQDQPSHLDTPHKYLYLTNVALKPGEGQAYYKLESDEVQALRAANAPSQYLGMVPITGAGNVIFFDGFDSFADLQKHHDETWSNAKLAATLTADSSAEAPSIADLHTSVYEYRDDLSLRASIDLSQVRFFDITLFHVRSGHHQDWERLVKLYMKAFDSIPDARWATFEKMYGEGSDNTFILVTALKSLAGVDDEVINGKKLPAAVGKDQLQTLEELGSATVESSESDLFAVRPQISYVPDAWVSASPDFWGKK